MSTIHLEIPKEFVGGRMKYEKQNSMFYVGIIIAFLLLMVPTKDAKGTALVPNGTENQARVSLTTIKEIEKIKDEWDKWLVALDKEDSSESWDSTSIAQSTPAEFRTKSRKEKKQVNVFKVFSIGDIALRSELIPICACESTGTPYGSPRHYDENGNVLRGEMNPEDFGMCQINRYFHGERANKMGLNILTIEGNIAYANDLYEREGSAPWYPSKSCWSKIRRQELAKK